MATDPRGLSGAVIQRSVVSDPTQAVDRAIQRRSIAKKESQEELNNLYKQYNIENPEGLNQNYREGFFKIKEDVYEPALAEVVAAKQSGDPKKIAQATSKLKDVKSSLSEYVLGSKERMKRAELNHQIAKTRAASNYLTQEGNESALEEFNSMINELDGSPVPEKISYQNGQLMVGDTPWRDYARYGRVIFPEAKEEYDQQDTFLDKFKPETFGTPEGASVFDAGKYRNQINLSYNSPSTQENFKYWVLENTPAENLEEAEMFITDSPKTKVGDRLVPELWKEYLDWGVKLGKTQISERAAREDNDSGGSKTSELVINKRNIDNLKYAIGIGGTQTGVRVEEDELTEVTLPDNEIRVDYNVGDDNYSAYVDGYTVLDDETISVKVDYKDLSGQSVSKTVKVKKSNPLYRSLKAGMMDKGLGNDPIEAVRSEEALEVDADSVDSIFE